MKARLPAAHERNLLVGRTDRVVRRVVVLRGLRRGAAACLHRIRHDVVGAV